MSLVVFYISDHGFGHASRNIPLIEALLDDSNCRVLVKSGPAQIDYINRVFSGHPRLVCERYSGDVGIPLFEDSLRPDIDLLKQKLRNWTQSFDETVRDEALRIEAHGKAGVIISDISPIGFLVADLLGVKSIGISNFTWLDQYEYLLGGHLPELQTLREAYNLCVDYLRYPFACDCTGITCDIKDIGFISRDINEDKKKKIRARFKEPGKALVFVGLGRSCPSVAFPGTAFTDQCTFLMTEGVQVDSNTTYTLSIDTPDIHNYIAACDLAITKAGWSTIAECIRGRVPMLILNRPEIFEDWTNLNWIKKYGIGDSIALETLSLMSRDKVERLVSLRKNYETFVPVFERPEILAKHILTWVGRLEERVRSN